MSTTRRTRALSVCAALSLLSALVGGCDGSGTDQGPGGGAVGQGAAGPGEPTAAGSPAPSVTTNVRSGATGVRVDTALQVEAVDGTLASVKVRSQAGEVRGALRGEMDAAREKWVAGGLLEPGTRYRIRAVVEGAQGEPVSSVTTFTTQALSLSQQTYPSISPLAGETVGVGMPVVVTFDLPVRKKAAFEKRMRVTSAPAQEGSWRWVSDREAHWRPRAYWQAGTTVSVAVDINSVAAGAGIYGQEDREIAFTVGEAHIYRVNARTHRMKVIENGKVIRTLPVTTGKPGFTTRSGVKVIMEKSAQRRMNSETVGIAQGSAEAYDIADVKWAMRLTSSGEFIHAAPWSVGSQGRANVSHGCTGLSTEDAGWLYAMSRRGDVVEYVGTDRRMEPDNGYGDWNLEWDEYVDGSAL